MKNELSLAIKAATIFGIGILFYTVCVFFLFSMGVFKDDPYDPLIGPRNPRPGAETYLASRTDISDSDKEALLNFQDCCSPDLFKSLAQSPSREVRSLVAANPSVGEDVLEMLLSDPEPGVRQYMIRPHTPDSILVKLKNDPDENVQWSLQRRQSETPNSLPKNETEQR